ncbi:MAG: hypothetical protein IJV81_05040 [Paludibacteraceae bacterium]|nr:hypothetical protein [Paludibacteraceae bacterium]
MKRFCIVIFLCIFPHVITWAQNIPVSLSYTKVYDFIDELIMDGVVTNQTAIRPYTRNQIADMLTQAQRADSLLSNRQQNELKFYLNEFALENDLMVDNFVQYTDRRTFSLSLADPQFSYKSLNNMFKMRIRPILGGDVMLSKKGAIVQRWWGAEIQMDIAKHLSIWGSLRDNSWNGNWLNTDYFPSDYARINGARIHYGASQQTPALSNIPGVQYKEATYGGDFSDSKGGINLYSWWGSIGIQRENIRWGDSYHSSNILSGRNPAVPMITLQLTPCKWFQFDYFHAWLVSNVLDSTYYYLENTTNGNASLKNYRPYNKFMAANMFTFTPIKHLSISLGNSIVYAEQSLQVAYLIPIAFYKSLDHLLTKGVRTQNQNSQVFASISVRPVNHLQLYGSFFLDEVKFSRFKLSEPENNPISYLVGFNWSGWPIDGLSLKGEFMRSYIACYTHSIDVLTWASNSYNMGHYMGDNAQSIYAELAYRPVRGLLLKLSYTNDMKYNSYSYLRDNISETIAQKPFDHCIYRNDEIRFDGIYEAHPNMYLRLSIGYNNAQGFDNLKSDPLPSEYIGTAQQYLDAFCPLYYQGKNLTISGSFSFGF